MVGWAVVGDDLQVVELLPPPWFFWTFAGLFGLFCPLFIWLWLRKRREHMEFVASHASVEGVVVDRVERTIQRPGHAPRTRVDVTVEYRDQRGALHRMTDEEGSFFRFVGNLTPVIYNVGAPADARLEVHRGSELAFLGVSALFVGITVVSVVLALVTEG